MLTILNTHRRIGQKKLELLVGKLLSMHPMVPGAVDHTYHIQSDFSQDGKYRAWLPPDFH